MASERSLGPGSPPLVYRIDEVSVRITRHPGNPNFSVRRLSLSGDGSATLERDGKRVQFPYTAQDLLAFLNELYKIRFFDLPTEYTTRYSVFLKSDGTVGTAALDMLDTESTSVCFAVPGYKKCITYRSDGPLELENIVKRIFSDAERVDAR